MKRAGTVELERRWGARFHLGFFVHPKNGCWIWFRASDRDGYGFASKGGRRWYAHRLSYHIHNGPIPPGAHVCHRCDRPQCVNPDHLFLGSAKENAGDCARKGRFWDNGGGHHSRPKKSKLRQTDVMEIRKNAGSHRELASRFNVSPTHIFNIRNGRRRKGLGDAP